MKTMLGPRYDYQVEEENRFHPSMLFNYLKSLKVSDSVKTDDIFNLQPPSSPHAFVVVVFSSGENGFAGGFDEYHTFL